MKNLTTNVRVIAVLAVAVPFAVTRGGPLRPLGQSALLREADGSRDRRSRSPRCCDVSYVGMFTSLPVRTI